MSKATEEMHEIVNDMQLTVARAEGYQRGIDAVLKIIEEERGYSPLTLHDCCSYQNMKRRAEALR